MTILREILTGKDNETVAIGRFMGLVLLGFAISIIPIEIVTVKLAVLTVEQWGAMMAEWQVFLPIVAGVAGGLIAGTAFTEPPKKDEGNADAKN